MKEEEKIAYMRIAMGIVGFGFSHEQLDMLVSIYDFVIEKEGEADLRSINIIEAEVKTRANIRAKEKILDKISTKI